MQSLYLLCRSSASSSGVVGGGGGSGNGVIPPSRSLASFVGMWARLDHRVRRPADRTAPMASGGGSSCGGGEWRQDHYAVLGISRSATAVEVKRAYRLLARKYHPDVSRDSQAAGEVFKSIHMAYEVLSNEIARARYDMMLKFPEARSNSQRRRRWPHDSESAERVYRRQQMQEEQDEETSWNHQRGSYRATCDERVSFSEVLRFAFFTLFFMQMIGHRASLALCGAAALVDRQLDFGYKMGYVIAWIFGGRGGVFLAVCVYFASWLCGKKSSGLVALVVVAMWVGTNVASFVPIPQGALVALLYTSMKLQMGSN